MLRQFIKNYSYIFFRVICFKDILFCTNIINAPISFLARM